MFGCLFCLSISCDEMMMIPDVDVDVDVDAYSDADADSYSYSRFLFIRHFNTFDSRRRHCSAHRHADAHNQRLFLFAALVWVNFSSIAVAASSHTHTHARAHPHSRASIDNNSAVHVMRDFPRGWRWSRGVFVAILFAASTVLFSKPAICSLIRRIQQRLVCVSIVTTSICMFFVIAEILCSTHTLSLSLSRVRTLEDYPAAIAIDTQTDSN